MVFLLVLMVNHSSVLPVNPLAVNSTAHRVVIMVLIVLLVALVNFPPPVAHQVVLRVLHQAVHPVALRVLHLAE